MGKLDFYFIYFVLFFFSSVSLQVVSTKVGGIPEVLPEDLIYLTEPNVESLVAGIKKAIDDFRQCRNVCPYECNMRVREYYSWATVTARTEIVYQQITQEEHKPLGQQIARYLSQFCFIVDFLLFHCRLSLVLLSIFFYFIIDVLLFHCRLSFILLSIFFYFIVDFLLFYYRVQCMFEKIN